MNRSVEPMPHGAWTRTIATLSAALAINASAPGVARGAREASHVVVELVRETPASIVLRIDARAIQPGSIELLLSEDDLVVAARGLDGEPIRSLPVKATGVLSEADATADWDDGWIVMTLKKLPPD